MEGRRKIAYSWRQVEELLHLVTSGGREGGGGGKYLRGTVGRGGRGIRGKRQENKTEGEEKQRN